MFPHQAIIPHLWYSLSANLATGTVLGTTLLLVAWLTLSGKVALAQAGIGVAVAGSRLAFTLQARAYLRPGG